MDYKDRLKRYEQEKVKLMLKPLTEKQYQNEIKKLADKYKI